MTLQSPATPVHGDEKRPALRVNALILASFMAMQSCDPNVFIAMARFLLPPKIKSKRRPQCLKSVTKPMPASDHRNSPSDAISPLPGQSSFAFMVPIALAFSTHPQSSRRFLKAMSFKLWKAGMRCACFHRFHCLGGWWTVSWERRAAQRFTEIDLLWRSWCDNCAHVIICGAVR